LWCSKSAETSAKRRWLSDGRKSWHRNGFSSAIPSLHLLIMQIAFVAFLWRFFVMKIDSSIWKEGKKSIDRIMLMTLI
jgi:hypothetical protein